MIEVKKKLIIVNGVMGVGKTSVCRMLYKELDNSFWLDGDDCWRMNPFTVNEENKTMVLDNIIHILNNYIRNSSSQYIIFNWVIYTDEIMEEILKGLNNSNVEIYKVTLMCSAESLVSRIKGDISKGLRDEEIEMFNKLLNSEGILEMSQAFIEDNKAKVIYGPLIHYQDHIVKIDKHNRIAVLDIEFLNRHILAGLEIKSKI